MHRGGEGRASDRSVVSLSEGDAVGSTPGGGGPNRHAPQQIAGCAPRCARFSKRVAGATGSPRIHPDLRETDVCVSRKPNRCQGRRDSALCNGTCVSADVSYGEATNTIGDDILFL